MRYQIIRIEKRKTRQSVRAMLRHALREDEPSNADPDGPRPHVLCGSNSSQEALHKLSKGIALAPRLRKDSTSVVEFLVTGSPEAIHGWSRAQQDQYFAEALDFVVSRFGGEENILTACVHRDESTPHIQILIMPRDPETGRFVASKMIGGPPGLRRLHDDFFEQVGRRYGLARGERGIGIKHIPIRQFYAALAKTTDPLPSFVEVPPAPTYAERFSFKSGAVVAAQKLAKERNEKTKRELLARAKVAAQTHPRYLAREKASLRRTAAAADAKKKEMLAAEAKLRQLTQKMQLLESAAQEAKEHARVARKDLEAEVRRIEALDERFRLSPICEHVEDLVSSQPSQVRMAIGSELGIELPEGPIIEQVRRRRGLSSTAQAVELIEKVLAELGLVRAQLDEDDEPSTTLSVDTEDPFATQDEVYRDAYYHDERTHKFDSAPQRKGAG